ncbi:MAG: hypothetical protein WA667_20290 [Candidatus Nitrosopolaris sp.]
MIDFSVGDFVTVSSLTSQRIRKSAARDRIKLERIILCTDYIAKDLRNILQASAVLIG